MKAYKTCFKIARYHRIIFINYKDDKSGDHITSLTQHLTKMFYQNSRS